MVASVGGLKRLDGVGRVVLKGAGRVVVVGKGIASEKTGVVAGDIVLGALFVRKHRVLPCIVQALRSIGLACYHCRNFVVVVVVVVIVVSVFVVVVAVVVIVEVHALRLL